MEARTLGAFVTQEGILETLREAVPQIIEQATREAKSVGKHQMRVVSCFKCTAPRACCSSVVVARLYEGIVVAAHLAAMAPRCANNSVRPRPRCRTSGAYRACFSTGTSAVHASARSRKLPR